MAGDRDKDTPSLEPPSLFGRKKKATAPRPARPVKPPEDPAVESASEPTVESPTEPPTEPSAEPAAPGPQDVEDTVGDDSPTTILDDTSEPTPDTAPTGVAARARVRAPLVPHVPGPVAAVLTGLLIGALIVGATAGSLRLCTKAKGTSSCGGPGFFLLVAILVVAVLLGAALLRAARVPEPGSTSFLAVGLLSVVALLFLVGQLFAWWMIIVIPLVSVATFLLAHWVARTYIDPSNDGSDPSLEPEEHDVR